MRLQSGPRVRRIDEGREYFFEEGCHILELSNDPLDPEVSIARARLPAGAETRWHRLQATTERYVIIQGRGEVSIGDLVEEVSVGDVVIIPAGVPQKMLNAGEQDLIFLAVCTPRFTRSCYEDLTRQPL